MYMCMVYFFLWRCGLLIVHVSLGMHACMYVCMYVCTVDREIFAVKIFLPVAPAAKIKRTKIKYTYMCYIAEPSSGEIFFT